MKRTLKLRQLSIFVVILWILYAWGCSTTHIIPPPPPNPPKFTQVPHPEGTSLSDITALLTEFEGIEGKKMPEFAEDCDKDFKKLAGMTLSQDELRRGSIELVQKYPILYHWCFYAKIYKLENDLKKESFLDERQKQVLNTYEFLTLIAKAFAAEFHDSRYLRCAVTRYRGLSEWVFFRRLEMTAEGTALLVQAENPFGVWRKSDQNLSILQKYHIGEGNQIPLPAPVAMASIIPDALSSPLPSPMPSIPETLSPVDSAEPSPVPLVK